MVRVISRETTYCMVGGIGASLGWVAAVLAAIHVGWPVEAWISGFFALATAVVLLHCDFPKRIEALSGSLYGWMLAILVACVVEYAYRLTTAPNVGEVTPLMVLARLLSQGLAVSVFVGWLFRIGWLLPLGMAYAFAPRRLKPTLSCLAERYPLQWWWMMPLAIVLASLILGIAFYAVLAFVRTSR